MGKKSDRDEVVEMGPLWRLPALKSRQLGKTGPAFGVGFGCGVGFAIGLIGGFGPGFPGLHLGYGLGAGCGVGVGFGYGVGRGIAYDGKFHSNLAKLSNHRAGDDFPLQNELYDLVDELVVNTQKLMQAASRAIDQRRKK